MGPASMYDTVRVIPPERSDSPAGSQPNDTLAASGLNWRGAAGPAPAAGSAPGRTRPAAPPGRRAIPLEIVNDAAITAAIAAAAATGASHPGRRRRPAAPC